MQIDHHNYSMRVQRVQQPIKFSINNTMFNSLSSSILFLFNGLIFIATLESDHFGLGTALNNNHITQLNQLTKFSGVDVTSPSDSGEVRWTELINIELIWLITLLKVYVYLYNIYNSNNVKANC